MHVVSRRLSAPSLVANFLEVYIEESLSLCRCGKAEHLVSVEGAAGARLQRFINLCQVLLPSVLRAFPIPNKSFATTI